MKKAISLILCASISACFISCGSESITGTDTANTDIASEAVQTAPETQTEDEEDKEEEKMITVIEKDKTEYSVVYGGKDAVFTAFTEAVTEKTGAVFNSYSDEDEESDLEILIGADGRREYQRQARKLAEHEFSVTLLSEEGKSKLIIAYTTPLSGMAAGRKLVKEMMTADGLSLPEGFQFTGKCTEDDVITVSSIDYMRDPAILVDNGVYYAYGTGWKCFKNTSGSLKGEWTEIKDFYIEPSDLLDHEWAPEVHKYNGAYYMFATYRSKSRMNRGCTVMKADSPEGPFVEISNGHLTPSDWDAIDASLYVDKDGQPWMIFAHEWTSTHDNIGTFAVAKLSDDLTHFTSEPVELFRADSAKWAITQITDGCFLHDTKDGELLMIWSNFDKPDTYCVGVAKSENGKIDGNWIQTDKPIFTKKYTGIYDGGHGMLFTDTDGTLYMSVHSPNKPEEGDRRERPVFIPLVEKNGTLVWEFLDWS